jgi:hypothetical protein
MKTDINALVQEAVLDCANPAGIFQKLYTTFSDLTSPIDQGSEIQKRLLDEGLTRVMPVPKAGVPHQEITGEGVRVIGLVLAELKLDKNDYAVIKSLVAHKSNLAYHLNEGYIYLLQERHMSALRELFMFGLLGEEHRITSRTYLFLEAVKSVKLN